MDTAQEALFRAMLNNGWFTESDGDVEFSLGYFGYVVNHPSELKQIREEFEDIIGAYGNPTYDEIVGVWWASINSNGIITITKIGDIDNSTTWAHSSAIQEAQKRFKDTVRDYVDWSNDAEEDDIK